MTRPRTISLDEKTAIIAGRMPNFSMWVRQKLLEHAMSGEQQGYIPRVDHIAPESARVWGPTKDRCNPKHRKGLCQVCYGGDE